MGSVGDPVGHGDVVWHASTGPPKVVVAVLGAVSAVVFVASAIPVRTSSGGEPAWATWGWMVGGVGIALSLWWGFGREQLALHRSGVLQLRRGVRRPFRFDVAAADHVVVVRWWSWTGVRRRRRYKLEQLAVIAKGSPDDSPDWAPYEAQILLRRLPRRKDAGLVAALRLFAVVEERDLGEQPIA